MKRSDMYKVSKDRNNQGATREKIQPLKDTRTQGALHQQNIDTTRFAGISLIYALYLWFFGRIRSTTHHRTGTAHAPSDLKQPECSIATPPS